VKIRDGKIEDEAGTIQADVPLNKDIDRMTFEELLLVFLGTNRLASAKGIDPSSVSVDKETDTLLSGRVKDTRSESIARRSDWNTTASTSGRTAPSDGSCASTWERSSCDWIGRRRRASSGNCCGNETIGRSSEPNRSIVDMLGRREPAQQRPESASRSF